MVVAFPVASPVVDGWRERTCDDRPSIEPDVRWITRARFPLAG